MSEDQQILQTAQHMIERYGEDACRQVEERIRELDHSKGDHAEASAIWRQVREAIVAFEDLSPKH